MEEVSHRDGYNDEGAISLKPILSLLRHNVTRVFNEYIFSVLHIILQLVSLYFVGLPSSTVSEMTTRRTWKVFCFSPIFCESVNVCVGIVKWNVYFINSVDTRGTIDMKLLVFFPFSHNFFSFCPFSTYIHVVIDERKATVKNNQEWNKRRTQKKSHLIHAP